MHRACGPIIVITPCMPVSGLTITCILPSMSAMTSVVMMDLSLSVCCFELPPVRAWTADCRWRCPLVPASTPTKPMPPPGAMHLFKKLAYAPKTAGMFCSLATMIVIQ